MADMLRALQAVGVASAVALQWAEPCAAAAALHDITTPRRLAAWLAQCSHESAHFTRLEEGLVYTSAQRIAVMWPRLAPIAAELVREPQALANAAYDGRLGNGPRASGDGWRYRGRGLIQITGRDNYRAAGRALRLGLEEQPDQVLRPDVAALTAAWFWTSRGLNGLADAGDIAGITRAINGPGMAGAGERLALYQQALRALSVPE
jgi:putative chitinase